MNASSWLERNDRLAGWGLLLLPVLLLIAGCSDTPNSPIVIPPLNSVTISPRTDTLVVNQTRQFSATARDTNNVVVSVPFDWTSSNTGVFTVSSNGRVRAVGEGSALLFVEVGGKRDSATIFVYPDTGWFVQPSAANGANLNGVFFQSDGRTGFAVGDGGKIVGTTDAGDTWSARVSSTTFNLQAVWFTTSNEGWVVGNSGTILNTLNGGATWTRLTNVFASENLLDVTFATPDTGWVVGASGVILRTFDRGASWQKQNVTGGALNSVAFAGTRDGWAVGSVIVGTHDRGLTWFVVQPNVTVQPLRAVARRSESLAWAVGDQGVTPRTQSGPDSTVWVLDNAGASNQLDGVFFPTNLIGYAVGFNATVGGTVLRTDDGGSTWESQASHTNAHLKDVFFVDALRGWAVGEAGVIVHTARGGKK